HRGGVGHSEVGRRGELGGRRCGGGDDRVQQSRAVRIAGGGLSVAGVVGGDGVEAVVAVTLGCGVVEGAGCAGGIVGLDVGVRGVAGSFGVQVDLLQPGAAAVVGGGVGDREAW